MKPKYWAVLILVILAAGVSTYALVVKPKVEEIIIDHKPTIQSQTTSSTVVTEFDTKDWKTYKNDIYGFEFKYPNNLKADNSGYSYITFEHSDPAPGAPFFDGLSIEFDNNFEKISPEVLWEKYQGDNKCASGSQQKEIGGATVITVEIKPGCGSYEKEEKLYTSKRIMAAYGNRVVYISAVNVPEADQIALTIKFTKVSDAVMDDGMLSYVANNKLFTVTKNQFKISGAFTPEGLESSSSGCVAVHPKNYYEELLLKFPASDLGTTYDFTYIGKSQDSGHYEVTVIPNRPGYRNMDQFNADFGQCDAGGDMYPYQVSDSYLMFIPACGTGFDDGSGIPHGCQEVKDFIEPSLKLK